MYRTINFLRVNQEDESLKSQKRILGMIYEKWSRIIFDCIIFFIFGSYIIYWSISNESEEFLVVGIPLTIPIFYLIIKLVRNPLFKFIIAPSNFQIVEGTAVDQHLIRQNSIRKLDYYRVRMIAKNSSNITVYLSEEFYDGTWPFGNEQFPFKVHVAVENGGRGVPVLVGINQEIIDNAVRASKEGPLKISSGRRQLLYMFIMVLVLILFSKLFKPL